MQNEPLPADNQAEPSPESPATEPKPDRLVNSADVSQPLSQAPALPAVPPQPSAQLVSTTQPETSSPAISPNGVQAAPTTTYLTGSQLQPEKKKIPAGIYVIAALNLLGAIAAFFDTSQTSGLYTIAMLISLALAVGLFMRLEVARVLLVSLSGIIVILSIASMFLLFGLQQKIADNKAAYESAVSRIDKNRITAKQKQTLETIESTISEQEKQAGKAITFTYVKLAITTIEPIVVIVYLTRPRVKEVFQKLGT